MEDKGLEFAKPPPEPEDQSGVNRSVPRSTVMRELGMKHKTTNVPPELQWAAEDRMVMRSHEDFRCQLPDVSRSTFLMVFSPDGKKVASTHGNHNVYVTDLTSGKNIKTLTGHPRTPWCIAFHPSSNQILASGCLGGQVRVWDLSGGSEIWMAESQTVIASLAFHPIDRMLVVASYNELHFWDWSQPEPFAKCFTANEKEKVRYVAFDTLGHKLITGIANAPTRPTSQWDRVAAPQPPPPPTQQMDSERRITICYRYMVEQYEQLVQRYCDLSRARATLTMDRGTDPMETEGETSDSQRERPTTSTPRAGPSTSPGQSRRTLASGTDEASASHSSTEFLSPPPGEEVRPLLSISPHASDPDTPVRRNPRFNISLPSFSRSQNARPQTTGANSRPLSRYSLSLATARDLTSPPSGWTASSTTEAPNTTPPITRGDSILGNVFWNSRDEPSDGTSTEVNSGLESENEEVDVQNVPQSGEESQAQSSSDIDYQPLASNNTSRSPRSSESSARRSSEASVSQLRSQFHRLQSVYENRNNAYSSHAHVFSPETQDAERRLLTRLNEILERPLPEANRPRRFFVSRRSAFQPRPASSPAPEVSAPGTTAAATTSDAIGGVRYGIQLLSRHIDNMQRLCRARLEILQLQQIRRMWEDLQSQIYALHGAVRDNTPAASTNAATSPTVTSSSTAAAAAADLLTDDDSDGPGSNGDFHWRQRRTPQTNRRHIPPRTLNKRSRLMFRPADYNRRMAAAQMEVARRELNRQASSSTQATSEGERGEASSSHVSSTSDERGSERGVKRKSQDCDPLFRPRPTISAATSTTPNNPRPSTSRMAAAMSAAGSGLPGVIRETIIQLENALWRHSNPRHNATRNTRLSRFTRQREERRLRNLWDTESSHESSRDDQSEGDSSQQSTPCEADNIDNVWIRESTRMRARQVLLLMVDSLTNFFENDNLTQRPDTNEALNDRIHNLYVLLQLALNLTDLLLAQLVHSRRELESRPSNTTDNRNTMRATQYALRASRYALRASRHARSRTSLAWRRILRRAPPTSCAGEQQPTRRSTPNNNGPPGGCSRGAPPHRHTFRHVPGGLPHPPPRPPIVPIVRVNDLPVPPPEATPAPRVRLYSPPMNPMLIPPRFFYPASTRYAPAESTSEDSSPAQDRSNDFFFMRAGYGPSSVILTDTPMSPHHRIQAWDFSQFKLPDLGNAEKNIVVSECKIHNDASVDMSKDGRLLVTLLPSGRLSMTTLLGVYSLQWSTLGQLLYTTSFEQSIVSVSLSPTTRHLVVGLASRRVAVVSSDRHTNAQVFRLEGASPGRKLPFGGRGRLLHQRDLDLSRHLGFMSLNCIRWAPHPGQGLVYGTNTGHLRILR